MATLKDLMNLPSAIENELEMRSQMKAEAFAHRIVNKVTGSNMQPNPYLHNPYHSASSQGGGGKFAQNVNEILGNKE